MESYRVATSFMLLNDIFTLLFIIASFAICFLAWKSYKITGHKKPGLFSLAFLLIGLSHLFIFINFIFLHNGPSSTGMPPVEPTLLQILPMILFSITYLLGIILLLSTTLQKWQIQVPLLLASITIIGMFMVERPHIILHIFSTLFIIFITIFYFRNYLKQKNSAALTVFLGFLFLLAGDLILAFSFREMVFFTIGRTIQLAGYCCLLIDMWLVMK